MIEQTFWIITDKDGNYYCRFCMKNKKECIEKFEQFSMRNWEEMQKKGFKCIKIKMIPCLLEENVKECKITTSSSIHI